MKVEVLYFMSFLDRLMDKFELRKIHFIECVVSTIELTWEKMSFDIPEHRLIFLIFIFDGAIRLFFDIKVF